MLGKPIRDGYIPITDHPSFSSVKRALSGSRFHLKMFRYRPNQDKMPALDVNALMGADKKAEALLMQMTE